MAGHAAALVINNIWILGMQAELTMTAVFYDPVELPAGEAQSVQVLFDFDATPAQIENAIEDAVIAVAAKHYPAMTLNRSGITMIDIKRGS
jgi:hypothetical protein